MRSVAEPYAEIIGDPVWHSRSPAIHLSWLRSLAMAGDYRATRVSREELAAYLASRRADPSWRGCNVTAPLKQAVLPLLDGLDPAAERIGAVNCIVPEGARLVGYNSDVDGVRAALSGAQVTGARVVVIGAGGAARAAITALSADGAATIRILARDVRKGEQLLPLAPQLLEIGPFTEAEAALSGACAILNATPLGSAGAEPMPRPLLDALAGAAPGATALDMVYAPLETQYLRAARAAGLAPVDGLTMLTAQARRAFQLFFGDPPPPGDEALRALLAALD
ncbi:MAG TPA: shikimate dehydrogenase [Allosphingosinicella sp.]|jgi:shikimate dehydrogenase